MNNRWVLYASIISGVSILLFYVAYNGVVDRIINPLRMPVRTYQLIENSLSQETFGNKSYEETIGWMYSDRVEEELTYQGYVVGWDYYEAQTSAAKNLAGLQHWATSLDYGVVEPFVYQSFFKTSQFVNKKALRFRDYFDINIWNHNVMTTIPYGMPLVGWEHFIKHAARQLIIVHVMICSRNGTTFYVNDNVKKSTCFQGRGFTNTTFDTFGFKVLRQVCFKFSIRSPIPIDRFNKIILGPYKATDVSIIFTFVPGVNRARINILETKYHHRSISWLRPSKRIINSSKRYIDTFLSKNYVAVSLRTVKMAISIRGNKHPADIKATTKIVVNKCIDKIRGILSNVTGQHFMTIDIGRFGDPKATFYMSPMTVQEIISKLINVTYNNSWNQTEWENTFIKVTDGIIDSGFIASLQKEIVSQAALVITAGGGSFQSSMILQHKLYSAQNYSVHQPCSIDDLYPMK